MNSDGLLDWDQKVALLSLIERLLQGSGEMIWLIWSLGKPFRQRPPKTTEAEGFNPGESG